MVGGERTLEAVPPRFRLHAARPVDDGERQVSYCAAAVIEQEIFEGMEPGHTENGKQLYVFKNCQNRRCSTTKTKSGVSTGVKYKYWQFLSDDPGGGNPDKADGWIVIDTGG